MIADGSTDPAVQQRAKQAAEQIYAQYHRPGGTADAAINSVAPVPVPAPNSPLTLEEAKELLNEEILQFIRAYDSPQIARIHKHEMDEHYEEIKQRVINWDDRAKLDK